MRTKYVVIAVVACCASSIYFAVAEDGPLGESTANQRIKELNQQVAQLVARVERLERQIVEVRPGIRFASDRPRGIDSNDDKKSVRQNGLRIPSSVDEGMMIDALQHHRR